MNREELHEFVSSSTGNESNICQISAFRDGITAYEDCWHECQQRGKFILDLLPLSKVKQGNQGIRNIEVITQKQESQFCKSSHVQIHMP